MKQIWLSFVTAIIASLTTAARAGSPYVGIEGGLLYGRENDVDEIADFTTVQIPATPLGPAGPADREFDDTFNVPYKLGLDVDFIGGYDFGIFRTELELGYRHAPLGTISPDETAGDLFNTLNSELNRPSVAPDPGAPGLPELTGNEFNLSGKMRVWSAMINGLLDFGVSDRISVYGGGGYGRSWAKALGDKDGAEAWQYIFGARYKLSRHVELGIKQRYFNSGILKLQHNGVPYAGNPNRLTVTPPGGTATEVDQTTNALLKPEIEGEFRTRSLLASLIYNF